MNESPSKVARVLPDWMSKANVCSPSKRMHDIGKHTNGDSVEEISPEKENRTNFCKEQAVQEEHLPPVGTGIVCQPKAHQLSDEEEEVIIIKDETCNEEVQIIEKETSEEQEEELATVKSHGEQGSDGEDGIIATDGPATPSQNGDKNSIQKLTWRVLCEYGAKCYRKNPNHKKDFCHPGDDGYDAIYDSLPACPYGARCYRKNKAHWQVNSHPPASLPARTAKRTKKHLGAPEESYSDSEDSVDSFLNDVSSDDYQPTETDSKSDSLSDDGDEEEEPDAKRMRKEARKFTKKKK